MPSLTPRKMTIEQATVLFWRCRDKMDSIMTGPPVWRAVNHYNRLASIRRSLADRFNVDFRGERPACMGGA